jgi:magnesium transporter
MGFVDSPSSPSLSPSLNPSSGSDEERAPLKSSHPFFSRANSAPNDPHTPTAKETDLLIVSRLRRKGITESQEIWEELEDSSLPPISPFSYRRASSRSTPHAGAADFDEGEFPHEGSALLGPKRSNTIRTYRSRRRRSAPVLSRDERERERRESAQAATGGWWKMRWWGDGGEGKGKAKGRGHPDEER